MKNILKFIFLLSILTITTSCDKDDDDCYCVNPSELRGVWEWVKTTGHCCIYTPGTEGEERFVRIGTNVFEEYRSGVLVVRKEYEITQRTFGINNHMISVMDFTDGSSYYVNGNRLQLTLSTPLLDADVHEYIRR